MKYFAGLLFLGFVLICLAARPSLQQEEKMCRCSEMHKEVSEQTKVSVESFLNKNISQVTNSLQSPLNMFTNTDVQAMFSLDQERTIISVVDVKFHSARIATLFVILQKYNDSWIITSFSVRDEGIMKFIFKNGK